MDALTILLLGAALARVCNWIWLRWRDRWLLMAENWTATEGEVLKTGRTLLSHAVRIRYRYFADNQYRHGFCDVELNPARLMWPEDPRSRENRETIAEMRQTYVPGMKVTVRYDPEHPSRSVLWY